MPLERALSVADFLAAPGGHFVNGTSWLVFHVRDHVAGLVMWGDLPPEN